MGKVSVSYLFPSHDNTSFKHWRSMPIFSLWFFFGSCISGGSPDQTPFFLGFYKNCSENCIEVYATRNWIYWWSLIIQIKLKKTLRTPFFLPNWTKTTVLQISENSHWTVTILFCWFALNKKLLAIRKLGKFFWLPFWN